MSNIAQQGVSTIRPSKTMYWRYQRAQLPIYGLVLVVFALNAFNLRHHLALLAAIYALAILFSVTQVWLAFRNRRVEFDATGFAVFDTFNRARRFSNADVAATVFTPVAVSINQTATVFLAIGHDGKRLVRLTSLLWDPAEQSALAASIGVTPARWDYPVDFASLRKIYPAAVPWVAAHRVAFALIVASGALIAVIASAIVVAAIVLS